jgi:fermentation-respiration switch protein FrsA (DUF1100 family)
VKEQIYQPEKLGLKYDDLVFQASDGTRLAAWHFKSNPQKKPKGMLVFFHGNGENLSSHFITLGWLLQFGYEYMIFDYRGYGRSEGTPSPEGTVQDGMAAIRFASKQARGIPLIVFAQSLGGAVALRSLIELKKEVPVKFVVIDSSFLSYRSTARRVASHHWLTWLFQPFAYLSMSDSWAPGERVSEISPTPILVIHGTEDQIIDFEQGEELFRLAGEPKEFWKVEGGKHTDVFTRDRYRKRFLDTLNQIVQ